MAAANYANDVLKMFYGEITEEENRNLPRPLLAHFNFKNVRTDF